VDREEIKAAVEAAGIRLLVATDARARDSIQTLAPHQRRPALENPLLAVSKRLGRIKRSSPDKRASNAETWVYHETQ